MLGWTVIGPECLTTKKALQANEESLKNHFDAPTSNNVKEEQATVPKTTM